MHMDPLAVRGVCCADRTVPWTVLSRPQLARIIMVFEGGLLATALVGFWSVQVLATGTAWAGSRLIRHRHGLWARGEREARAPHFPEECGI